MKIQIVKKGSSRVSTNSNVCPWLVDIDVSGARQ